MYVCIGKISKKSSFKPGKRKYALPHLVSSNVVTC